VTIGESLNETELFIRNENGEIVEVKKSTRAQKEAIIEGHLVHSSTTRICFVNGIQNGLISSGDNAVLVNNKLYLKGRNDRIVKINAKLLDLNNLENVFFLNFGLFINFNYFYFLNARNSFIFI
jgi:hypothetical protein